MFHPRCCIIFPPRSRVQGEDRFPGFFRTPRFQLITISESLSCVESLDGLQIRSLRSFELDRRISCGYLVASSTSLQMDRAQNACKVALGRGSAAGEYVCASAIDRIRRTER